MANVDFTLSDIKELIDASIQAALTAERKHTEQMIHSTILDERKHTRRNTDDSIRKALQMNANSPAS